MAAIAIILPVSEKHCSKCKRMLPAAMFNKANWLPSGLRSDCKDCYRAFKKEWWLQQPKGPAAIRRQELARLAASGLRQCKTCRHILPATNDNFVPIGGSFDSSCRDCARARTRQWALSNPERYMANAVAGCAARYAEKKNRTPKWLTAQHRKEIRGIYAQCRRITKAAGIPHHVDHMVPLIGKTVCGLHVPWNLQIIPGSDNCKKSNKWNSSLEQDQIAPVNSLSLDKRSGLVSSL